MILMCHVVMIPKCWVCGLGLSFERLNNCSVKQLIKNEAENQTCLSEANPFFSTVHCLVIVNTQG